MKHAFGQLAKNLRALGKLPSQVAKKGARELEELIDSQFEQGVDPYGRRWARLKNGQRSFLQKSGELRRSLAVIPRSSAGIRIRISDLAAYHQSGTKWMSARPILPKGAIPDTWVQIFAVAYETMMKKAMKS